MKKILLLAAAAIIAAGAMQAQEADQLRIYLNPGHGSWGPNDRPMATIPYPMLPETGRPDTCGFYESNTNLWKVLELGEKLEVMGVQHDNIVYSRVKNGPFPYVAGAADAELYNKPLAAICEEVEEGNFDMFISVHSNALTDGTATNYPLYLYRGYDKGVTGTLTSGDISVTYTGNAVEGSWDMCDVNWGHHYMNEIDPQSNYSLTSKNLRGDINFMGSGSISQRNNGNYYGGYYGVLKHGVPGFLLEGYFHTYQPARHRALNMDYCHQEGVRIARGVCDYFDLTPETTGYIMGTVKDLHEKIVNNLFNYAPGSVDQWLPLNGAVVTLKKDGAEVASYTVDNNYNGIFFFEGLEPGQYTLDATLEGYKPLFDEYKEPITVTANATTYPLLYLEAENYEPPTESYENYPDPEQPAYIKLPGEIVFDKSSQALDFVGTIKDAVQLGDSTIVLTNEGKVPHLYLVKTSTKELIKELSTEGIYTEDSPGFFSPLNAINRTADMKLVGVSLTENQYDNSQVTDGYTRGTARVYIWNDFDSAPSLFASTTNSGNYYVANVGHAILVNGASNAECEIIITAMTTGSTCNIRLVHINMLDGVQSTVFYDNLYSNGFVGQQSAYGEELHMVVSPNGDDKTIFGGMGKINEFVTPAASTATSPEVKQLSDEFGATGVGFQCFKYAGHNLLVTPYAEDGTVKGIKILDITDGIDKARLIKTVNTDIDDATGTKAHHDPVLNGLTQNIATAYVNGEDIIATLVGNDFYLFSTEDVEQPKVKGIYAYDLNYEFDAGVYTFTFKANDDANEAYITFINPETGEELLTLPLENIVLGENEVTVSADQLSGIADNLGDSKTLTWEITLVGDPIARIDKLNEPNDFSFTRIGNAVDTNPESPYFGRFYLVDRIGSSSTSNAIYAYTPEWEQIGGPISGEYTLGNPFRLAIDQNGTVYLANWADGARSGVFKLNPETLSGDLEPFFIGTHASNGTITNDNGEMMCTSTPSVFIAGKGANTHMYCHLEDANNDISQYNIGNEDGTIMENWSVAPTRLWGIGAKLISTHGAVIGENQDGGIWVVQNRSAGNNDAGVPSLIYVNPEGEIIFNSGSVDNPIHDYLSGTQYAAGAISPDGKELVVNQPDGTLKFFELEYTRSDVPTLTYKYEYKHGVGNTVTQINYDYAGNLFVSAAKLAILSMPTEDNSNSTPSTMELVVSTGVNDLKADTAKKVVSVKYVNVAGIESSTPFQGVNIMVTRYEDGSQTATKVIK